MRPGALAVSGAEMSINTEIVETLRSIGDLLDLEGERFKPEAYRRAARSIETLTEDLATVEKRNELETIPGVGEAIEEKIREYLRTGKIAYHERLRAQVPPGVVDMMRLSGVGPKTARRFWTELRITSPLELGAAITEGRLEGVSGIGPKKIELLRAALSRDSPASAGRIPLAVAYVLAERLVAAIRASAPAGRVEVAGSLRRRRETVGDLDVLVSSDNAKAVFDVVSALPEVREVLLRGGTKETVRLRSGLQVDVRVVTPEEFGAALVYFTGSKDHNVHLRTIARDRGLKINEYAVFRGETRIGGRTEEEVYATLDLAWIPPELREDRGEIEDAAAGTLPHLIEEKDVRGELLWRPCARPSVGDFDTMLAEARRRRFEYVGVVVSGRASDGTPVRIDAATRDRLHAVRRKRPSGAPVVWLVGEPGQGSVAPGAWELDYVVRPEGARSLDGSARSPAPTLLVVPGNRTVPASGGSPRSRGNTEDGPRVAMEVGPGDERLDSIGATEVRVRGGLVAVPTGLCGAKDDPTFAVAIGYARRARVAASDALNTWKRSSIEELLRPDRTTH